MQMVHQPLCSVGCSRSFARNRGKLGAGSRSCQPGRGGRVYGAVGAAAAGGGGRSLRTWGRGLVGD